MALKLAGNSGANIEVETNTLAARAVLRADDYGSLGIYSIGGTSGTIVAGSFSSAASIFSCRYAFTNIVLIKKIIISAANITTAFTAGLINFSLFFARSCTAQDSGGNGLNPVGDSNKFRVSDAVSNIINTIANTGALTPGTRTLDAQPLAQVQTSTPNVVGAPVLMPYPIWDSRLGEYPIVLANNEGFVIQATTPLVGTFQFTIQVTWEEVTIYGPGLAI